MARECGWDKDFIAERFTVQQINRYYELIQEQKNRDLYMHTVATLNSVGYAFGTLKKETFKKFLDMLVRFKVNTDKDFEKLKQMDLPVEDK